MIEELKRVCALQRAYSSINTPEMSERGILIRQTLPQELYAWRTELAEALGAFGDDMGIEGSDGVGRKTEAPWIRVFSQRMSPAPTEGFYVVIHFAADGSALFVTVGFGSTVWRNGDLKPEADGELERRRDWGRSVLTARFGALAPFADRIALGAKADLPRTFEKATVVARRIAVEDLEIEDLRRALVAATVRLAAIYEVQLLGADMGDVVERELAATTRPQRFGQGFGLSAAQRSAVERRAMVVAREWLIASGFRVKDTSKTKPYDYEATDGARVLKVEVKGTTSPVADVIVMTANEVALHLAEVGATALVVVSGIRLTGSKSDAKADGGEIWAEVAWDIETWDRTPLAYRLRRRAPAISVDP